MENKPCFPVWFSVNVATSVVMPPSSIRTLIRQSASSMCSPSFYSVLERKCPRLSRHFAITSPERRTATTGPMISIRNNSSAKQVSLEMICKNYCRIKLTVLGGLVSLLFGQSLTSLCSNSIHSFSILSQKLHCY